MTFIRVGNVIFDKDKVLLLWQDDRDVVMWLENAREVWRFIGPDAGEVWRHFDPDPGWREEPVDKFPNLK